MFCLVTYILAQLISYEFILCCTCYDKLSVDKNLRYHGLIQAFSRTNHIFNKVKSFGNIVCFRDLEQATKDAIKLFGDENSLNIILERSYADYMHGFVDKETCLLYTSPSPRDS